MVSKQIKLDMSKRLFEIEKALREHPELDLKEFAIETAERFGTTLRLASENIKQVKWRINNG